MSKRKRSRWGLVLPLLAGVLVAVVVMAAATAPKTPAGANHITKSVTFSITGTSSPMNEVTVFAGSDFSDTMANPKKQFEKAAQDVKKLPARQDNDTLLRLYAMYKQATEGDVAGKRPGMLDMVGRAKYHAWARLKGTTKEQAMQAYVELVGTLLAG